MAYVDGFVIPIKRSKLKAYKKMALLGKKTWLRFGALDYQECVLDERKANGGVEFPRLAKARNGETVVFAYIKFKSKAHRNAVNKKVLAYFSTQTWDPSGMPWDPKRMSYGGFKVLVGR